jgi:hypothetical protein
VEEFYKRTLFPAAGMEGELFHTSHVPFVRSLVPNSGSEFKVSTPAPNLVYGYTPNLHGAFSEAQNIALIRMAPVGPYVNSERLTFPFLVTEFKSDGPTNGSLWVATNQCAGGSATCVRVVDRLNELLRDCNGPAVHSINNASFSIGISEYAAKLFISWKHEDSNYLYTRF